MAFVSVYSLDNTLRARVPIALVEDRLILLPVPATSDQDLLIASRLASLRRRVAEGGLVQAELFKEINDLTKKPELRARALERVGQALERTAKDVQSLSAERDELQGEINKLPAKSRPDLAPINERLARIKSGEAELQSHLGRLEKIEREENDPKKKAWLEEQERANLLVKAAELGGAIKIYEKAPKEFRTPGLEKHLAELRKLWEPKNDQHKAARHFIYKVWPGLDTTAALKERQKDAEAAFATCRDLKDKVGLLKMHRVLLKHLSRLEKELDALRPETNSDDIAPARLIKEVAPWLQKLEGQLREELGKD
jgi:chromosome segregation ATPase